MFWQRYWYYIGGVIFVILTFIMGLWGCNALDYVTVLLIFSWMGMLVHQFEEYAWPGGFPLFLIWSCLTKLSDPTAIF